MKSGLGGQQLAELVDDHEQVRQRRQVRLLRAQPVVGDVGDVAGVLEHLLAALHLPGQALVRPLDQAASSARLVMMPATCGTRSNGANDAPPL